MDAVTSTAKFAAFGIDAPAESEAGALLPLAAVAANASGRAPERALAWGRAASVWAVSLWAMSFWARTDLGGTANGGRAQERKVPPPFFVGQPEAVRDR